MKYRLAIFDLDGTLADSFPWFLRIANSVADKHGFRRIEAEEIESLRGKGSREIVRHLRVPMWRMPLIARDVRRMKAESLEGISLFAGVDAMLASLSAKGVVRAMVPRIRRRMSGGRSGPTRARSRISPAARRCSARPRSLPR